jgi:hypothetical protein
MKLEEIIKIKNNKSELINFLKNEECSNYDLIKCANWSLRNCKYDYFDLLHNKIYNQYNDQEVVADYFVEIINVAAKYNKFDIYKSLFNDPKFSIYVNEEELLNILSNCFKFYRPLSFSIANSNLEKVDLYMLMVKFLSQSDFISIKNAEKHFNVLTKKHNIDFNDFFNFVKDRELFHHFNYGFYSSLNKNTQITFYDLLIALDKKNVFFESLDTFIDTIQDKFSGIYKSRQNQLNISKKVRSF